MGDNMGYKDAAVLGEVGAPGSDGFGAAPDTREIRVFDDTGKVVYRKRTNDTAKASDGHISNAGYKRVGDWQNGVAPVARQNWLARSWPTLTGVGIVVLLFAGCQGLTNAASNRDNEPTKSDANYYCKEFVKDRLKAPSTAVFSGESASGSGSSWTSTGAVESQNGFGGMVQNSYRCTLTYSPSDESWRGQVVFD